MKGIILMVCGVCIVCSAGCAPLIVGGVAATAGTGTYIYVEGDLERDYNHRFEDVWAAGEKMLAQMNASNVVRGKDVGKGELKASIEGETVWIKMKSRASSLTTVSIRVGYMGDRLASQRLHDIVADNLVK